MSFSKPFYDQQLEESLAEEHAVDYSFEYYRKFCL